MHNPCLPKSKVNKSVTIKKCCVKAALLNPGPRTQGLYLLTKWRRRSPTLAPLQLL